MPATSPCPSPLRRFGVLVALGLPALSFAVPSAVAQAGTARSVAAVALAPDAHALVYVTGSRAGGELTLLPLGHPAGTPAPVSLGQGCLSNDPAWSPDSATVAVLARCAGSAQQQIYLYTPANGQSRQLTHAAGELQHLHWSPDGKQIGFLFVENATRSAGALDAMKPWSGVIGEDGIETQRVAAVDAATGTTSVLTPKRLHAFEFDWAPDSRALAYIAAPNPGENNWWIAQLYTQAATAGTDPVTVLDPAKVSGPLHGLQMAVPRFSPDGKQISFIGGLMSDQGSTGGDLWVVASTGGEPTDITPGIDGTPTYEEWLSNTKIGFVEERRGRILLPDVDVSKREIVPGSAIDLGEVSVSGGPIKDAISSSPKGVLAFASSSFTAPPEVWAGSARDLRPVTHLNQGLSAPDKTESVEWENEGFHIQGWLTYPAHYDSGKKYPVIVSVHGGPSSAVGSRWSADNAYAANGYFVFQPNPRGSFGQGEAFTAANRKDFGYGDLRDILAGLDTVEKKVSIDPHREGLTGWSYGGFMTMFAVTQTHRFRAAVAGAGISDWQSYYGENSIDQWMTPFFGATVYDDPKVYAKSSAIDFIKNVTTPTLVIVGDRDGECPAPQSFEFWHALRAEGVKTQLVIYPNEGHGFRDPGHIADRTHRELDWFAQYMPASGTPAPSSQTAQVH